MSKLQKSIFNFPAEGRTFLRTLRNSKPCVYVFFDGCVTVFPLALFLDKQRSFDIHGEQNATLAQQFVNFCWQSFQLVLLEPTLCCQWELVFWRIQWSVHWCSHLPSFKSNFKGYLAQQGCYLTQKSVGTLQIHQNITILSCMDYIIQSSFIDESKF